MNKFIHKVKEFIPCGRGMNFMSKFTHKIKEVYSVRALAELVDASLLLEYGDEYEKLSPLQEPRWRVKMLLMKLESDRRNKTDYFTTKFHGKAQALFDGLPKKKEYGPFTRDDLPLLFTDEEVQQFALDQKLNKSQTRAIDGFKGCAPETFKAIAEATPEDRNAR